MCNTHYVRNSERESDWF